MAEAEIADDQSQCGDDQRDHEVEQFGDDLHRYPAFTGRAAEIEVLSEMLGHLETPPKCEGFPNFATAN